MAFQLNLSTCLHLLVEGQQVPRQTAEKAASNGTAGVPGRSGRMLP